MRRRIISMAVSAAMAASMAAALPFTASAAGVELLNFDYDDNVYFETNGQSVISLCDTEGHSGTKSIKVSKRSESGDGAKLNVELNAEETVYTVSMWVKTSGAQKLVVDLGDERVNAANVPADTWVKIEGDVALADDKADLVVSGTNGTDDFLIDDVSVLAEGQVITTPYAPEGVNMFLDGGFETGDLNVFEARGGSAEVSEAAAHSGKYGVSVTNRTEDWMGIQTNIKDLVIRNTNYEAKLWVKINNPEPVEAEYFIQLELASEGSSTTYPSVIKFTASSTEWREVKGVFSTADFEYPVTKLLLYIGSADGNKYDFMADEFSLSYTTEDASSSSSRPAQANPWVNTELTPLKDVYKDYFLMGSARGSDTGKSGELEEEMLKYHFDIVTMGNDMKPDYLEPTKGKFTFTKADSLVDGVLENGLMLHGHVFVWHEQSPDWLTTNVSREEAIENMRQYIYGVGEHYKGKCYSWRVVNEAIDGIKDTSTVSGILRNVPWKNAIGEDYIEYAFKFAAEAVPEADLYYNDFNLDDATKADAVVTLVKDLQSKGIRIDGIGMQAHYSVNTSIKAVENSIKKFADLGVKISITELDVGCLQAGEVPTQAEYVRQAQKYAELFSLFKKYSDVIDRVTLWGIDDGTSWRAENYPLLFDQDYQPKEAYYAVLDPEGYLEEHPVEKNVIRRAGSAYGTPVIDGEIDEIWNSVPETAINRYVMAWQGATGTFKSMWDEDNLYVLIDVKDPVISTVAADPYMQDSVEVFLDENNAKQPNYEADDAQYRVSCENEHSFGTNATEEGFVTATKKTDTGYLVEIAVPFKLDHAMDDVIGFDVQINDDGNGDGNRTSIAKFNDMTDLSWGNTENWGELLLNTDGVVPQTDDEESDEITVIFDGETLSFDVAPQIINDRTLVPFRTLFEKFGATVEYIEDGQYVNAVKGDTNISLQIDNTTATVNGAESVLDCAPIIVDGRTLVPLRFIAEALNADVDWDGDTRTVTIVTK